MSRNLIAILRGIKPDEVLEICEGLVESGITKIEVPLNSPEPFDSIEILAKELSGDVFIGAGTVLTRENVLCVKDAGGTLIVSPDCNPDVIDATVENGMQSWPGVATATEAFTALRHGATGLKFFPGTSIRPEGLKALKAVLPKETALYPVGGVAASNFDQWVDAGATGFGIGTALYKPGMSASDVIANAKEIIAAYDAVL